MTKIGFMASILLTGIVAGAAGAAIAQFLPNTFPEARVLEIVDERLASDEASREPLDASIETYLMANPEILERVSEALARERSAEQRAKNKEAIESNRQALFEGLGSVVVGNPNGDVTIVEMYDYNCEYCRQAMPDLVALIEADPELKVILRQFPILSSGSLDAAKVGTLVADEGADYWNFHQELFTSRGQINLEVALGAAATIGLNPESLRARLNEPATEAAIAESFTLAQQLGITGTPTFIIGDEIIPGAVGVEVLREKVANVRACGSTACGE